MNAYSSIASDAFRAAWNLVSKFLSSITPDRLISLAPTVAIAVLAYFQWRVNLENSRRYYSEKLLEYFAPIQEVERLASELLSARQNYDKNIDLNRFADKPEEAQFSAEQQDRINKLSADLKNSLRTGYDSMLKLILFLGLHRPEVPAKDREHAAQVQAKARELLTFADQCRIEIIEYGYFEIDGNAMNSIIDMSPRDALSRLRRLGIELTELLMSRYKIDNL
jgi:hypothetical protein